MANVDTRLDRIQRVAAESTNEQAESLMRLIRDWKPLTVSIAFGPFDLPPGYWLVTLQQRAGGQFVCGIAPDGSTPS